MSVEARRRFGAALALGLALGLGLMTAGEAFAQAGRAWTDPPTRTTVTPPDAKAPATVPQAAEAPAPKTLASKPLASKPLASKPLTSKAYATEARPRVASRAPPAPVRVAKRRIEEPRRSRIVALRPARVAERPHRWITRAPVVVRYGYAPEAIPVGRVGESFEDDRAVRIRQAQDAGFLVMRSQVLELPDGRRIRTSRPYEEHDADE